MTCLRESPPSGRIVSTVGERIIVTYAVIRRTEKNSRKTKAGNAFCDGGAVPD